MQPASSRYSRKEISLLLVLLFILLGIQYLSALPPPCRESVAGSGPITQRQVLPESALPAPFLVHGSELSGPAEGDPMIRPMTIRIWNFSTGCLLPVRKDGQAGIFPRQPRVNCSINAPQLLTWVRTLKDYSPNPFNVRMSVTNAGDEEARNVRFKVTYDSMSFTLVAPTTDVQNGTPSTLDTAGVSTGSWDLLAKRRLVGDSLQICITASFDNHPDVQCCAKIWVAPADAVLECSATGPIIISDCVKKRYSPMPFDVTVLIANTGGKRTDTVYARIIVPPELQLYGPDSPNRNTKKAYPAILNPGQSGAVSWTLWHPVTQVRKEYIVGIWVKTSNADSSYCEVPIIIPPFDRPCLNPMCIMPDSLRFDRMTDGYSPNPFTVSVQCSNPGSMAATKVTAFISLPDGMVFADSTETRRKTFNPSTIPVNQGAPLPELSWNVVYTNRMKNDSVLDFRVVVGSTEQAGLFEDSAFCVHHVRISRTLEAKLSPVCRIADTLRFDANADRYIPNPFTVSVDCPNHGELAAADATGFLSLPDGVVFADSMETARKSFNPSTINPYLGGPFPSLSWNVLYTKRLNSDTTLDFRVAIGGTSPKGFPIDSAFCTKTMLVRKILSPLVPTITARGALSFCEGGSVTLDAGQGYATYKWSTGASQQSIVVKNSGNYTVTVTDKEGRSATSPAVIVVVYPLPLPRLTPSGLHTLCDGDTLFVDAGPGYGSYRWNTGQTEQILPVTAGGVWFVDVMTAEGCPGRSDTMITTLLPSPPVPTIDRTGDHLSTQSAFLHQWFRDGTVIAGAIDQNLKADQPGRYTVAITNEYGCSRTSAPFLVTTLPVEGPPRTEDWSFNVHPDPASDHVVITTQRVRNEPVNMTILNHIGQAVVSRSGVLLPEAGTVTFNFGDQPPGVYFLIATSRSRTVVRKFVKLR